VRSRDGIPKVERPAALYQRAGQSLLQFSPFPRFGADKIFYYACTYTASTVQDNGDELAKRRSNGPRTIEDIGSLAVISVS
jgi:hypothetical protein